MTRDYAKRAAVRKKGAHRKQSGIWKVWIFTLALFIAFTLGLVYLGKYHKSVRHVIRQREKPAVVAKTEPVVAAPKAAEPQFDFYTMLQKKPNAAMPEYELAVAVVKDFATADHLKAELTLFGFSVSVVPVRAQGKQRYSVTVGPYDNKEGALADQAKLKQNGFKATFIKK